MKATAQASNSIGLKGKQGIPLRRRQPSAEAEVSVRPLAQSDRSAWFCLWTAYNAFYGRSGKTVLPKRVTEHTWQRCVKQDGSLHALVATIGGKVCGFAHVLFHEATISLQPYCYLSDIYTDEQFRGRGIGRALIEEVFRLAKRRRAPRVYWQTHASNAIARKLYDQLAENSGFIVYRKTF